MANQVTATANLTNGSQNIIVPGVDLTGEGIIAGHGFYVVGEQARYQVSAPPTFDGTDTTIVLTGVYAGDTATGVSVVIQLSYTTLGLPRLSVVARNAGAIVAYLADKVDAIFQAILDGTQAFTNPAAVRTQLVARALHKTDTRPAAADMNAGDLWADTDYATGLCAVYCIIDPANAALDTLDYFIKTDTGGRLNLENSIATTIDCSAGGTITLSALQNAYGHYNLTGSPSADFNLVVDNRARKFTVNNATGKIVTVKTSGGSGIIVPNGIVQELRGDGTNVVVTDFNPSKVARWVMRTDSVLTNLGYWAKIATITPTATNYTDNTIRLLLTFGDITYKGGTIEVDVAIGQGLTGFEPAHSQIAIINNTNKNPNALNFKLVGDGGTNGLPVELWIQNNDTYGYMIIRELSQESGIGSANIQYVPNATWQAAEPTGVVEIASDWAGSGQLTSTSFQNGWAGTAYYEKSADGWVHVKGVLTTIGATADTTVLFVIPEDFRPTNDEQESFQATAISGGSAGVVRAEASTGNIKLFAYAGGGSERRFAFKYRSRN